MAIDANKHFLDYSGLQTLWSIITGRFADKDKAITSLNITTSEDGKTQTLNGVMIEGGTPSSVQLPNATEEHAGLMSADHFTAVRDLQTNIDKFAPFAGLKLHGTEDGYGDHELSLTGRKATIGLEYSKDENGKAYISLLDPNYPSGGKWVQKDANQYEAAANKINWATPKDSDGTTQYWEWVDATTESSLTVAGPVNALGEPIAKKPISQIDVTELVKTGLLAGSDVVLNPADQAPGTYLKLSFYVFNDEGEQSLQDQYINVTDLVDLYTAGEGVHITYTGTDADDTSTTGTINVIAATDSTLGAFRTGFAEHDKRYAIDLTAKNETTPADGEKAFVHVPWDQHEVVISSTGVDSVDSKPYLVVSCEDIKTTSEVDGSTTHKHTISVEAGDGIKLAEGLAKTAVQSIVEANPSEDYIVVSDPVSLDNKGTQVSLDLSATTKASLALADSAVQTVSVGQYTAEQRPNAVEGTTNDIVITASEDADDKGKKAYTITLGDRTAASLNLADTAVQDVVIMGKTLTKDSKVYEVADAVKAMELGTARLVNTTDEVAEANFTSEVEKADGSKEARVTVATTEAVKTYVDTVASNTKTAYESLIQTTVQGLDSETTANKVAAAETAQDAEAQTVFTKIVIEDGKLVDEKCVKAKLTINDITDFRALSEDEIKLICGVATV